MARSSVQVLSTLMPDVDRTPLRKPTRSRCAGRSGSLRELTAAERREAAGALPTVTGVEGLGLRAAAAGRDDPKGRAPRHRN